MTHISTNTLFPDQGQLTRRTCQALMLGGAFVFMIAALTGLAASSGWSFDRAAPTGLTATLVIRACMIWLGIGIVLAVCPLAKRHSNKERHALENC